MLWKGCVVVCLMFPELETMFLAQIQHKSVVEDNICVLRYVEGRQNLLISISYVCVTNFSSLQCDKTVCLFCGYSLYVWSVARIALGIGVCDF